MVSHFLLITLLLVPQILNSFYVMSNFSRAGVSRVAEKGWWESKRLQHVSQLCPISFHSKRQNTATELLVNDLVMSEFRAVHAFHVWEWGASWGILPGASFSSHGKQQLWGQTVGDRGQGRVILRARAQAGEGGAVGGRRIARSVPGAVPTELLCC